MRPVRLRELQGVEDRLRGVLEVLGEWFGLLSPRGLREDLLLLELEQDELLLLLEADFALLVGLVVFFVLAEQLVEEQVVARRDTVVLVVFNHFDGLLTVHVVFAELLEDLVVYFDHVLEVGSPLN